MASYTLSVYTYTMTTVRLTGSQKAQLEASQRLLENVEGRKLTQGEAIEELAQFALRHREILAEDPGASGSVAAEDPMFDPAVEVEMGKTGPDTIDRVLYRKR